MQPTPSIEKKPKKEADEQEVVKREKVCPLYYYPQEHISISALNSFDNCPFNFYLRYYLGVKLPYPARVKLGTDFQEMLNAKYADKPVDKLLDRFSGEDKELATKLLNQATNFNDIISIDSPYTVDLGLGIPVIYIPDLVVKGAVIENKYTSGYYNDKMVNEQKQGTLYYLGTKKTLGFEPEVIYQIFNKKNGKAKLIKCDPKTQKDIDSLLHWMDFKLKQIENCYNTGIWDTKNHSYFDCDLGKSCPIKYNILK